MTYSFKQLKASHTQEWQNYIQHDFVKQLGQGTLSTEAFQHYLKQDYLFLIHFARAYALAVYKSQSLEDFSHSFEGLKVIADFELQLHKKYCKAWGISETDLAQLPEAKATLAYTRYVFDAGSRGNLLDLHVALTPCLVGYAEVAQFLKQYPQTQQKNNPYQDWINMYQSDEFQSAAQAEIKWLDKELASISEKRFQELTTIFRNATILEIDFWQSGLEQRD